MMGVETIPLAELAQDLADSLIDLGVCERALAIGVTHYSHGAVADRAKANRHFVRVITRELRRRGRVLNTPLPDQEGHYVGRASA